MLDRPARRVLLALPILKNRLAKLTLKSSQWRVHVPVRLGGERPPAATSTAKDALPNVVWRASRCAPFNLAQRDARAWLVALT